MSVNTLAADLLHNNYNTIITTWEREVKKNVVAAQSTPKLALRNHVPNMLHDISELIRNHRDVQGIDQDNTFEEIIANSADHGRHRAATYLYSLDQVITEYIWLHRIITDFLDEHNAYSSEVGKILKYTIETAIQKSATTFTDSMQEMQEKLLATLAHDIRNPLGISHNCLELLEQDLDKAEFDQLRKVAIRSLKKSITLTEQLLDTISVQAGEGIMLNFTQDDYVTEVKTVFQEAKDIYNFTFELECPYDSLLGVLDGAAVRRVLENLLTNAIKYGDRKQPITISLKDKGTYVEVRVNNRGKPISEEKQKSIFTFLRHSSEEGQHSLKSWGIGLTLVKMVVEAHKGEVLLESSEEAGTTFSITFHKKPSRVGKIRTILNDGKKI